MEAKDLKRLAYHNLKARIHAMTNVDILAEMKHRFYLSEPGYPYIDNIHTATLEVKLRNIWEKIEYKFDPDIYPTGIYSEVGRMMAEIFIKNFVKLAVYHFKQEGGHLSEMKKEMK